MADCDLTIKLQKAMISLNKHERCTFKVRCCAASVLCLPGKLLYFSQRRRLLAENESVNRLN